MVGGHDDAGRVVVVEVSLEHLPPFYLRNRVALVPAHCLPHVPDHSVLTKPTDYEPLQPLLALVELGRQELQVLHPMPLHVIQSDA